MKITIELLRACWPCTRAYKWSIGVFAEAQKDVLTFEEGLEYLIRDNCPEDWIDWYQSIKSNPVAVMFHGDYQLVEKYRVYDFVSYFEEFSDLQQAIDANDDYKRSLEIHNPGLFVCQQIVKGEDGTETTVRVNLEEVTGDGLFRVFNPITVTFSEELTIDDAKAELNSVREQYFNRFPGGGLCQAIQNTDGDIAWVPYEGVK